MYLRCCLCLLAVLWPTLANAGPLSGTVLDGDTLEPIVGAELVIDGTDLSATTDEIGRYRFEDVPPGAVRVQIRAAGYEDGDERFELDEAGASDRVIVLLPPGLASETIELVGKAPRIKKAPGQTELTRKELVKLPGTRGDAMQVIKSLPGVANADAFSGGSAGLLVIRGAAPEDSIYLVDGVQIPIVYHFFGLQSVIPSEFIDDIEFLPGGFGVEQGRATGGIIHIHTRPNRSLEWKGFSELSFINVAGYLEGPLWKSQNLSLALAFRRSTVDLLLPLVIPDDANLDFTTAPTYYDSQLRLDWLPKRGHRVTFLGLLSYDLLELLSSNENANDPAASGTFFNETQFSRSMATWQYKSRAFESTAVASVGLGDFRVEIGEEQFLDGNGAFIQLREDAQWRAHDKLRVRFGSDAQFNIFTFSANFPLPPQEGVAGDPNFTTDPQVVIDSEDFRDDRYSLYSAVDLKPIKQLKVTPGVRWDYYTRISAQTVSPRLQLRYKFSPEWSVQGAMGTYTRPLDGPESIPRDLEPETATQWVLGAEHKISESLSATSSLFYTEFRRLIVQDYGLVEDPEKAYESYVNRGYGHAYGAEALVRARTDNFFGWVAYTISRGKRIDGAEIPERLFDYDQTHNFLLVASWEWGKWTFGGKWQFTTGEPDTPVEGSVYLSDVNTYIPIFGETNSDRIENAHQLDLRVDRQFKFDTWDLSLYLDVTNVYAHARTLGYSYSYDYQEREAFETLPILPALGVRGTF